MKALLILLAGLFAWIGHLTRASQVWRTQAHIGPKLLDTPTGDHNHITSKTGGPLWFTEDAESVLAAAQAKREAEEKARREAEKQLPLLYQPRPESKRRLTYGQWNADGAGNEGDSTDNWAERRSTGPIWYTSYLGQVGSGRRFGHKRG
jgi:hypothetical protein